MKEASERLGISYNIIYGKYREVYGPLSKKRTSKQPKNSQTDQDKRSAGVPSFDPDSLGIIEYNDYTGTREEFWSENYVNVLMKVSKHN